MSEMSRESREAMDKVTCRMCGATPKQQCFTPNGRKIEKSVHIQRIQALQRMSQAEQTSKR